MEERTIEKGIIFLCIGSNDIVGDLLGPLVGTYLKSSYYNKPNTQIKVYGDLKEPVNYTNIYKVLPKIENEEKNNKFFKVLIDSALGENIGKIIINTGDMHIGKGLNKCIKINGDICIKGIVGKDHHDSYTNFLELKNIKFNEVNTMAISIVESLKFQNV